MANKNPFYRSHIQDDDDEEITEETIKEAQQDLKFGKFMEKVLEMNKEKYFLMLAHQGVKFPHEFDITQLKKSERIIETRNDTSDTQTHNERIQNDRDNETRNNVDNSLLDLTQQIQALQINVQGMQG